MTYTESTQIDMKITKDTCIIIRVKKHGKSRLEEK